MKGWQVILLILFLLWLASQQQQTAAVGLQNNETWEWTDRWGHKYCINVQRQVH
jgi:hypothetical protein